MPDSAPWTPGGWTPGGWSPSGGNNQLPPVGGQQPPSGFLPPVWSNPWNQGPPGNDSPSSDSAGVAADYRGRASAPPNSVAGGLPTLGGAWDWMQDNPGLTSQGVGLIGSMLGGGWTGMLARRLSRGYLEDQAPMAMSSGSFRDMFEDAAGTYGPYSNSRTYTSDGRFIQSPDSGLVIDTSTGREYRVDRNDWGGPDGGTSNFVSGLGTFRGSGGLSTAVSPEEGARMFGNPFYQPGEMIDNRPQGERRE